MSYAYRHEHDDEHAREHDDGHETGHDTGHETERASEHESEHAYQRDAVPGYDADELPETDTSSVPPVVYRIALALVAWYLFIEAITYTMGRYEPVVAVVSTFFALMSLGIPTLISEFHRPGTRRAAVPGLHDWLQRRFQTASGTMSARDALAEILLIPLAVAVGFTAISIVEMLSP